MGKDNPGGRKGETNAQTTRRTGMTRALRQREAQQQARRAEVVKATLRRSK